MLLNDTAHSGNSITRFFESICKPSKAGDSGFVKKKKKKKKAIPVYDRNNIHKIKLKEEELVLTTDG